MRIISTYIHSVVCFMMFLLLCPLSADAQGSNAGERFDAHFAIMQKTFGNKSKPKYGKVHYHVCNTYKMAEKYASQLNAAFKQDNLPGGSGMEVDHMVASFNFQMKDSKANGTFTARVEDGMGVLVLGDDGACAVAVTAGKTEYTEMIQGQAAIEIGEVEVTAKQRQAVFKKVPSIDTGWEVSFNINAHLPAETTNTTNRLMIQPLVIECQTEDTVAYMRPMVYEGHKYHILQDRRMAFDYMHHDPVAVGYHPLPELAADKPFDLDTNVVFRKPDKDKSYKCVYFVTIEDYTHKAYDNNGEGTGSCLSYKPFKFLNFNTVVASLPLSNEFYDQAESRVRDVPRDMQLRFVVGTDELTRDSLNDIILNNLSKEMSSYGDRLTQIRIEGAASPDGSLSANRALAERRAVKAQRMLLARLGSKADYVRLPAPTVKVFTWLDVAEALAAQDTAKAERIRQIAVDAGDNAFAQIKQLPWYDRDVVPVLESQRRMKCSYQYEIDHVMNAGEAVAEYFAHKQDYVSGRRDLSDGDFFNLFAAIKDSTELDTLTEVAYRHMVKQPAYQLLRFSPWIANNKALHNIAHGIYDASVLRPFVDFDVRLLNATDHSTGFVRNRKEILLNQAITYFQDQKLDTAQYIIDLLQSGGNDDRVTRLTSMITFVRDFFKANRTPDEEAAFKRAYDYVLASNPDNRAVLYAELHSQMGKTRQEAERYVDQMQDSDPKKWYLKGIIWSDEAGKEPPLGTASAFQELTTEEFLRLQQSNPDSLIRYEKAMEAHEAEQRKLKDMKVPFYLAFFQHSFDLQPSYLRLYLNEGNISDDLRKKHPYRSRDIAKYRQMFTLIQQSRQKPETDSGSKADDKASDNAEDSIKANDNDNAKTKENTDSVEVPKTEHNNNSESEAKKTNEQS